MLPEEKIKIALHIIELDSLCDDMEARILDEIVSLKLSELSGNSNDYSRSRIQGKLKVIGLMRLLLLDLIENTLDNSTYI